MAQRKHRSTAKEKAGASDERLAKLLSTTLLGLTPRQTKALHVLIEGGSQEAAALAAGVHRNTLFEWRRRDRYFAAALEVSQVWLYQERMLALQSAGRVALKELLAIGTNKRNDATTRVQALKFIVEKSTAMDQASTQPLSASGNEVLWGFESAAAALQPDDRQNFHNNIKTAIESSSMERELTGIRERLKAYQLGKLTMSRGDVQQLRQRRDQIQSRKEYMLQNAPPNASLPSLKASLTDASADQVGFEQALIGNDPDHNSMLRELYAVKRRWIALTIRHFSEKATETELRMKGSTPPPAYGDEPLNSQSS